MQIHRLAGPICSDAWWTSLGSGESFLIMLIQVQRLIAVLSVPSIGRSALLRDKAPCFAKELPSEDKAVLLSAGWTEEDGLRALLNFSGVAQHFRLPETAGTVIEECM